MSTIFVASRSGDPKRGAWFPIGRLSFDCGIYRFAYTRGAQKATGFYPFTGMENFTRIYQSSELFPVFANRLLAPSRPEYEAYLRWSGFDPDRPPDPIALLGVTEGIRRTDWIEVFPCPVPDGDGRFRQRFFLHGLRHMGEPARSRLARLEPGEELLPMLDPANPADAAAIALRTQSGDRLMLGYIPRYLARDIGTVLRECLPGHFKFVVQQVNPDAPMQQRLLCRLEACWPEEFQPCSGDEFQPIPAAEPALCAA